MPGTNPTSLLLGLLRIVAGLLFLAHGLQKLVGFPVPPEMGLPPMLSLLWIGAVIELVTGTLIAAGFMTRIAAFVASGQMAVAYWMFHAPRSPWPVTNGGDAAILFCFFFLYLVMAGPGGLSVERAMAARRPASSFA